MDERLFVGSCHEISSTTFRCSCKPGWQGARCETQVDYCADVTCLNNGVCRGSLLNYTCQCLGEAFSGRHCEIKASATVVRQAVSRSLAFVAIIVLSITLCFIVVLDVLKYCFGIDPVAQGTPRLAKKRHRKPPVGVRFIYVNP